MVTEKAPEDSPRLCSLCEDHSGQLWPAVAPSVGFSFLLSSVSKFPSITLDHLK